MNEITIDDLKEGTLLYPKTYRYLNNLVVIRELSNGKILLSELRSGVLHELSIREINNELSAERL